MGLQTLRGVAVWTMFAALVGAVPGAAQLRHIEVSRLPPIAAVQSAYRSVSAVEPLVQSYEPHWSATIPKADVVKTIQSALAVLNAATAQAPGNEELVLLAGLVAAYGYNLDIAGTYDRALDDLHSAERLAPTDPRAPWFLGSFLCSTTDGVRQGMAIFLGVEESPAAPSLDADFWRDYARCAMIAAMPRHVLRAEDCLRRMAAPTAGDRFLIHQARARVERPAADRNYSPGDVWSGRSTARGTLYSSTACGLALPIGGEWDWEFFPLQKATCLVLAPLGPFPGKTGQVRPRLMILVRAAGGESLRQLAGKFARGAKAARAPACPAAACLAFRGADRGSLAAEGGEDSFWVFFRAAAPPYPGLRFETPQALPQPTGNKTEYFRTGPRLGRLADTLDYIVMLDTADSVATPALAAFAALLRGLTLDQAVEPRPGSAMQ